MHWFYKNYILPQLDAQLKGSPVAFTAASLTGSLESDYLPDYKTVREYWAIHAFLLGLRLGQGLSDASGLGQ